LSWVRKLEKEKTLKKILNISNNDVYNICHLVGDNNRVGKIPNEYKNDRFIEIKKSQDIHYLIGMK
jgi:beta-N-acetylglucosaminidase